MIVACLVSSCLSAILAWPISTERCESPFSNQTPRHPFPWATRISATSMRRATSCDSRSSFSMVGPGNARQRALAGPANEIAARGRLQKRQRTTTKAREEWCACRVVPGWEGMELQSCWTAGSARGWCFASVLLKTIDCWRWPCRRTEPWSYPRSRRLGRANEFPLARCSFSSNRCTSRWRRPVQQAKGKCRLTS